MHPLTLQPTTLLALAIAGVLCAPSAQAQQGGAVEDKGGLSMEIGDDFTFQVFGRIQLDAASYDQDVASLGSGTEFRRARIGLAGTFYEDWGFKAEYDFANEAVGIIDVYIQYLGFDPGVITAGNFKQPVSLDNLTSDNDITFMERPLTDSAFVPGRRIGVGFGWGADHWSANVGGFGETAGEDAGETPDGDEADSGVSFAGRVTFAPIATDTSVVHVGASAYTRDPSRGETTQLRTRPESNITDVRLVDTDEIADVEDLQTYGLEAAGVLGPLHAQGEYLLSNVSSAAGDFDFDGWYVESGYFLTGESRPYSADQGIWKRVTPEGQYGAWQAAARYSSVDLNDGAIQGGEEDNVGVALNWYPNYYLRFGLNYIKVIDHERQGVSDEPDIFQVRAQVAF